MTSAASALRSGSMSEAFSGQSTRSGCGSSPAATCSAAASVVSTWLSSTWRRCALNSRVSSGTLPWMPSTCTGVPSTGRGTSIGPSSSVTASSNAPPARSGRRSRSQACTPRASSAPTRTTTKPTPGTPSQRATPTTGESAWLKPSRAHGNPPKGVVARAHSAATQANATANGRTRAGSPLRCRYAASPPNAAT